MTSTSSALQWKFSQVFGERSLGEELQDVDVISSIEFDKTGDHLAVGDRGGRVVIFERKEGKDTPDKHHSRNDLEQLDFISPQHPVYQYKTEFQSHEPEFDYLKSLEIEEKINRVRWCATPNGSQLILSTNDKTIKLWKVKERKVKKVNEIDTNPFVCPENTVLAEQSFVSAQDEPVLANGHHLEWTEKIAKNMLLYQEVPTQMVNFEDSARARCRKVYAHAHDFNINSISTNSDGETFISADDLRINVWNLEISNQCFNIVDIKPSNIEDLTEVITSAEFHPIHCNLLAYSSSRGFIHLVDMRQSAICDHSARILQDAEYNGSKSFFTEIIASISDIKFTNDGRHILSRDYMNLKLWDMHMDSAPVAIFKIHEHLRPKLCDLYNNDSIFDKFECCHSGDGLHFATGSYSNLLRIFCHGVDNEEGITLEASKNPIRLGYHISSSHEPDEQNLNLSENDVSVGSQFGANRKSSHQVGPRARRSSLSYLTRGFYRQGNENLSVGDNDISCSLSSKLLHLAWHPTTNLIACASGNSLFMYYA